MTESLPPESPAEDTPIDTKTVHFGDRYLRNRPFLIIHTTARPASTANTRKSGWTQVPGAVAVFESASIVDRVSDKISREATIIIDILNNKVVKNRYGDSSTEEEVLKYFIPKYAEQITRGLEIWANQNKAAPTAKVISNIEELVKEVGQ